MKVSIKSTAIVLTAGVFLTSLTGCSFGKKKEVLQAADSYATAVSAGELDTIKECLEDDGEFVENVYDYVDRGTLNEDLEDVYKFIHENMTYTIDEKSVEVNDKKASVDITYTIVDYNAAYDGLREGDYIDEFLTALEENKDKTIDIKVTVDLELGKDDWKIVDDENTVINETYGFYYDIFKMGWVNFPVYTPDGFEEILNDFVDGDVYNDRYSYYDDCYYQEDGVWFQLYTCDTQDEAVDWFDSYYEGYQEMLDNDNFRGQTYSCYNGTQGYLLVNGDSYDGHFFDSCVYGGFYIKDNTIVIAVTVTGDPEDINTVNMFLSTIGYPAP